MAIPDVFPKRKVPLPSVKSKGPLIHPQSQPLPQHVAPVIESHTILAPEINEGMTVRLPMLFVDIMDRKAFANPLYKHVGPECDAFLEQELSSIVGTKGIKMYCKAEIGLLAALTMPRGNAKALRLLIDHLYFCFIWDDQFDEGRLKVDNLESIEEVTRTLSVFDDTQLPIIHEESPFQHMLQHIWLSLREVSSLNAQDRFKRWCRDWMMAVLKQTALAVSGYSSVSFERCMEVRRAAIGCGALFAAIEGVNGIDVPREVMEHPAIKACETAMIDMVILHNDLLSMRKDLAYDVEHNIVTQLRRLGMTMQEGIDKVGTMIDECFLTWHENRACIPKWDESIDSQVERMLDIWRDVASGSLHWSFRTGRYFSSGEGIEIRKTGLLRLPKVFK